jgi:SPP1 family predicted phage head-tail adaptor
MLKTKQTIGSMDYRITFQEKVVGVNESNEDEEEGWENIATNPTVWASKDDRSGNESYRADKLTDYQNTTFVCRYRTDITPKNRLVCEGIPYDIISIQDVSRRRYLNIECERGGEFIGEVITETDFEFTEEFTEEFNA